MDFQPTFAPAPGQEEDGDEGDGRHANQRLPVAELSPPNDDGSSPDEESPYPAGEYQPEHDQGGRMQRECQGACPQHNQQVVDAEVGGVLLDPSQGLLHAWHTWDGSEYRPDLAVRKQGQLTVQNAQGHDVGKGWRGLDLPRQTRPASQ